MTTLELRLVGGADVRRLLTPTLAYESQLAAFTALGSGRAAPSPRVGLAGTHGSSAFSLTARLGPGEPAVNKFGGVHPANTAAGLPAISALVTVLDPETGRPEAVLDGTVLTELRTAAGSAVAAVALSPAARRALVVGAGVQGAAHLRALAASHPAAELRIWSRDGERAEQVARVVAGELDRAVGSGRDLDAEIGAADLVVLCTSASQPLFAAAAPAPGATVVSIGSYAPDRHEVSQALLVRCSTVVVDDVGVALEHAGPVMAAVRSGLLEHDDLLELGTLLHRPRPVRRLDSDVVYYNSVGVGVQDAAAATLVARVAREANVGQIVRL